MHGTIHPLDETLDDHYNGRCAMLPVVKGLPLVSDVKGEEWFRSLSADEQRKMMGPGRYDAYTDGKFDFDALSVQRPDETYGRMRFESTLAELIGE
jgi:hypothetical protein